MQNDSIKQEDTSIKQEDTSIKTISYIGEGALNQLITALPKIAPIGAGILLISDEVIFDNFGITVERILRRLQYGVQRDLTLVKSGVNKKNIDSFVIADGARAVVSVGGGKSSDVAKYLAFIHNLPVAIIATSCATISHIVPSVLLTDDGFTIKTSVNFPQIFIADYNIIRSQSSAHLASGFGELTSRLFSFFEKKFSCIISGKPLDNNVIEQAESIVDDVLTALKGYTKGVKGVAELVVENGERLCRLADIARDDYVFCGADSGFCASVAMLFLYENREFKMWGENEFVLSRILAKVYRGVLEAEEYFMPPPNNNRRLKALKEYYGIDEFVAVKRISSAIPSAQLRLSAYRLNEYKQELFSAITQADNMLEEAYKIFKRLYDDDGFSLVNYLDSADAQLTIALAPDCMRQNTMLALLKNMGFLDRYII